MEAAPFVRAEYAEQLCPYKTAGEDKLSVIMDTHQGVDQHLVNIEAGSKSTSQPVILPTPVFWTKIYLKRRFLILVRRQCPRRTPDQLTSWYAECVQCIVPCCNLKILSLLCFALTPSGSAGETIPYLCPALITTTEHALPSS
eukprot:6173872-Pleurochrysis_carterae.AAC.1